MASGLYEPVYMIVLTGGPCSGKSTSLAYLTEKLSDHGFMVAVIPETATMITNNGINRHIMDRMGQILAYQEAIVDIQLAMEDTYRTAMERAFPNRKKILLLDRGVMDTKAYLPKKEWEEILAKKNLSEINLRDRYSGVVHLLTAADGAPEHYSTDGNPARLENTVEDAIAADRRTRNAWLGHRRFVVVDNRTGFEEKIRKTLNIILHHVGYPVAMGKERRYLVKGIDFTAMPEHQSVDIEQTYLVSRFPGQEVRLKRRGQNSACMYFVVRRDVTAEETGGSPREEEEIISEREYVNLLKMRNSRLESVVKERVCFVWNNKHYELDIYKGRNQGLVILETGFLGQGAPLPPFVDTGEEITGVKDYAEEALAAKRPVRGKRKKK
ncbi:MAG: hypothetical protein A4E65_02535 [Syntrophorhabdus sp. PtaU1.Bin153]|nr:MAG: hypothetical protein A4E65_02535 [Syntrophorhabdus sp. PtaU1.Bin153]